MSAQQPQALPLYRNTIQSMPPSHLQSLLPTFTVRATSRKVLPSLSLPLCCMTQAYCKVRVFTCKLVSFNNVKPYMCIEALSLFLWYSRDLP